jgi:hypothetical protein
MLRLQMLLPRHERTEVLDGDRYRIEVAMPLGKVRAETQL